MRSGESFICSVDRDRQFNRRNLEPALSPSRVRVDGFLEILGQHRKRWTERVARQIPRRFRKHFDGADVFQDACRRAMLRADTFHGDDLQAFEGWFSRILNTALLEMRRFWEQDRRAIGQTSPDDPTELEIVDPAPSAPKAEIERQETAEEMLRAARDLSVEYREVFRLRVIDDLSSGDVGARLGMSPTRVWWVYGRARAAVASNLSRLENSPPPRKP